MDDILYSGDIVIIKSYDYLINHTHDTGTGGIVGAMLGAHDQKCVVTATCFVKQDRLGGELLGLKPLDESYNDKVIPYSWCSDWVLRYTETNKDLENSFLNLFD